MCKVMLFLLMLLILLVYVFELKLFIVSYIVDWKQMFISGNVFCSLKVFGDGCW